MKKVYIFILILCLLVLGACSNAKSEAEANTNILKLDEEIFNKGNQILQMYYEYVRNDTDVPDEYDELQTYFTNKYESGMYVSEDEELFVSQINLLKSTFELSIIQNLNESISGDDFGESTATKEKMQEILAETKDIFGVEFKN